MLGKLFRNDNIDEFRDGDEESELSISGSHYTNSKESKNGDKKLESSSSNTFHESELDNIDSSLT
jgi:hypothetical protein